MPELPEVETVVQDLDRLVTGETISRVRVRLNKLIRTGPRRLARMLRGETIEGAERLGKFIIIRLSGDKRLVVHLKMTGQFLWGPANQAWPKHVHVIIHFESGRALHYRDMRQFGAMWGLDAESFKVWRNSLDIGPDPFQMTAEEFSQGLAARRGRIKPLLLGQRFVSGLGNIYVDESLFAAGIHPLHPADRIQQDQAVRLYREIVRVLEEAIHHRGSTTRNYVGLAGVGGEFQNRHRVYGRAGSDCILCHSPIERLVVGGRGTYVCPCCQLLTSE